METITNIVLIIAAVMAFFAMALYAIDSAYARQQAYAAANNCRYEGGLCYTYQERGYLWPEQCRADKYCAEQWGL